LGSSSWLATALDQELLEVVRGIPIAPRTTPINSPPLQKTGRQVSDELGGRYLLRYLLPHQIGSHTTGSDRPHWVTPTPYAPEETVSWLALPAPAQPRTFVMLLDPSKIPDIWGPRWVKLGKGIEYYLPRGFPGSALVFAWELRVT
jgi:hypothetical protein